MVRDQTESVIADVITSHLAESAHWTLSGPHLQFSPIYVRKQSNYQLTIPLSPINSNMSDMNVEVVLTGVMPGLHGQYLSLLTELRKSLGGHWMLGGDRGQLGVKNVLEAQEEVRRDGRSERTGKPIPGPGGKALLVARERVDCGLLLLLGPSLLERRIRSSWTILGLFPECRISISKAYTTCWAPRQRRIRLSRETLLSDDCHKRTPPDIEVAFPPPLLNNSSRPKI